jgi:lamin B
VDGRLRDEYDSKLISELQRIREQAEMKINEMKDEVDRRYQSKLADLDSSAKRNSQYANLMREDINNYKQKIDELTIDLTNLQNKYNTLETRAKETEDKFKRLQARYDSDINAKDNDIAEARKEIQDLLAEYQELYNIKIALDMEIGAYRKLLESEEQRLNISAIGATSMCGSFLAGDENTLRSGKKRRITAVDEELVTSSSESYEQSAKASCGIDILDHDFDGKVVKVHNSTDKEINIGGWTLMRLADSVEAVYKFHKSTVLKPDQTIAIWSANAGIAHDPPADLVMTNSQRWLVGNDMITVLLDKEGVVSVRTRVCWISTAALILGKCFTGSITTGKHEERMRHR